MSSARYRLGICRRSVGLLSAFALPLGLAACEGEPPASPPADGTGPNALPSGPSTPPASPAGTPALDPAIFPQPGATSFLTANENEQLSLGTGQSIGANGRGELSPEADGDFAGGAADEGAGAADPGAGVPAPEPEAVPDPAREIVEADVYKLEGDLLYVLNRWRGLVIIDVSDTSDLRVVGRLPFQAMPVEMYVREGRAYIVMSDYFEYWQYDREADPQGFHGSQVLIADVSVPARPVPLGSLPVDGEVTDTRMVGDVLYAVSHRRPDYWRYNTADWEDRTWIVSLNVADPQAIREIDRVTFQGQSTLIHVAHHAIFVAAWDPNFYLTDPNHEQETLVTYVDISEPNGDLRERGKVYIPGQIPDKFKMDWFDGHFRVLSQRWQSDENITLHVVATDAPDDLEIDASLDLDGVTNSGLAATRFDGERAFAATSRWSGGEWTVEELHTLDLSDPLHPARPAVIEIDQAISHLEMHGDRMLAMGRHMPENRNGRDYKASIGLFDVSNLGAPRLLDEELLGEGYSSSEAEGDYKAFKTFEDQGLILVPLSYWVPNRNRNFDGLTIVDWQAADLEERGRVETYGGVRRAFPVGERLVAVGDLSLVSIDATNRAMPRVEDRMNLVHQVHDVFDVQGLQVQIVGDIYSGALTVEVRPFGGEDNAPAVATLELPFTSPPNVFREGDVLHLLGYEPDANGEWHQSIRNVDLSDPRAPRLRGHLHIATDFDYIYNQGLSFYARYWSPNAGLAINDNLLPITYRRVIETPSGRRDFDSALKLLDLRDVDQPRIADGSVPMNEYPFVNKITHGDVMFSSHVEQATTEAGEQLLYHVRSYADRIDVSNPDNPRALPSINIPGYLVDVSEDGQLLFTVDFQWDDFGRRRNSLNVLRVVGDDTAELITVVPVPDQIDRAAFRPGAGGAGLTVWTAAHKYPWWGVRGDSVASRQPYTALGRLGFDAEGLLAAQTNANLQGYHFDLLDIDGDQAWLASTGPYGLLSLDVADAARPQIDFAARTLGYLGRIVVHDETVFAPMGWFGVQRYAAP